MVDKQEFKSLVDKVILYTYADRKDQLILYKQEGSEWIDAIYDGRPVQENQPGIGLESGASVKGLIDCISVLVGTFGMVKEIYNIVRGRENEKTTVIDKVKHSWKEKLQAENIDAATAERIVDQFSLDVINHCKNT